MNWFKRVCLFVFGLSGILALVGLLSPWGPYADDALRLLDYPDVRSALLALVAVTALGCLICLLRALLTPRNRKFVTIAREGGDEITVTRTAIASQAQHIVERDGTCVAGTVRVSARKRGNIRVFVRVTPKRALNVVEKGQQLQADLDEGLARIAADKIRSVNLQFTEPKEMDEDDTTSAIAAPTYDVVEPADATGYGADEPLPGNEGSRDAGVPGDQSGITVPMNSFRHADATAAEADAAPVLEGDEQAGPVEASDLTPDEADEATGEAEGQGTDDEGREA